jgi:hypothetical protein
VSNSLRLSGIVRRAVAGSKPRRWKENRLPKRGPPENNPPFPDLKAPDPGISVVRNRLALFGSDGDDAADGYPAHKRRGRRVIRGAAERTA